MSSSFPSTSYYIFLCQHKKKVPVYQETDFPSGSVVKNLPAMQEILGLGRSAEEGIGYLLQYSWASPVKGSAGKGRLGFDPWVGKIPWRRERLPTPVFWPGEFHGLYSLWGCKELDMTAQLSLSLANRKFCNKPSGI